MTYGIGDTIRWRAVNGEREGVVERIDDGQYIVRMDSGMYVALSTPERIQVTMDHNGRYTQ